MIYTLTFNPALDYIVGVNDFRTGQINRTCSEKIPPGGKGINVSIVLSNLGYDSTALGFVAGFTGDDIEKLMKQYGCGTDFIHVENGFSRINLKMKSDNETEINGQGPHIGEPDIEKLYKKLGKLEDGDTLIISGSIPNTLPGDIYEQIIEKIKEKRVHIIVDAEKELMTKILKYHPFLVKPNNHELGEIYGVKLSKKEDVIPYAKKLQDSGAQNVLVSMAGEGAVFISQSGEVFCSDAPKGVLVNSVGAGDSMVAGFVAGWIETKDYHKAFRMGLASGSASAFSTELATRTEVETLLEKF